MLGEGERTRQELREEAEKNWWDREAEPEAREAPAAVAVPMAPSRGRTVVAEAGRAADGRALAVTRVATVAAVATHAATEEERRREMARCLTMSTSILSGLEGTRRYSVPRRGLRPHFQLFSKESGVSEEKDGGIRLTGRRDRQGLDGSVWFI